MKYPHIKINLAKFKNAFANQMGIFREAAENLVTNGKIPSYATSTVIHCTGNFLKRVYMVNNADINDDLWYAVKINGDVVTWRPLTEDDI